MKVLKTNQRGKSTLSNQISRRALAKILAASGTIVGASKMLAVESVIPDSLGQAGWKLIYPGVWRATLGTPERFTPVSSRLVPPRAEAFAKLPDVDAPPLSPIEGKRTTRGFLVQLPLHPDEHVFGLGLQLLSFAQRGKKKIARVNADPQNDTGDTHAPVPFYVTTRGVGVLVDTARYASFYFGDAHHKSMHAPPAARDSDLAPKYTDTSSGTESALVSVEIPDAGGVDVYLFGGPDVLSAVQRYNVFSGGGAMPPEWGLGFWYRNSASANQQDVLSLARDFRECKIPCDVIGLEPGWQSHAYSCTFVWDNGRFPDPVRFLKATSDLQYKVNLWEHAFTHPASPLFEVLEPHSGDYGVWGGLVPDFAGKQAREVFGEFHGKSLVDKGISGFKLDECDNSDCTGGWSFPEFSSFPSGVDGEQMHSVFGLRYQMAIWNEFLKRGRETYGLVRSSGALAAPYPFVLYSDLYDHRQYIRALVNSGFSGLLWCPEVRQAANEEDLIRRLQSAVFSPLAQVDCWYMKNPPWMQLNRAKNNADELLEDRAALEARCREIIGWRMQLVPYLLAAFQRYRELGTPPFRALVLDSPQDKRLYNVDDQYMVGDRMMVAPLFAGERDRKVVFPQGDWYDFWTGAPVAGGSELSVPMSSEHIPVYVKSGSIIPWADVGQYAGASETRRITARVYGHGSIPFGLKSEKVDLQLNWTNGRGTARTASYDVYRWKRLG